MRTTKTVAYALACLQELAKRFGEFMQVYEIARNQNIPAAYCQKILLTLSRAGIVESVKGHGFMLIKPIETIATLEIIKAFSQEANGGVETNESFPLRAIQENLSARLNKAFAELSVSEVVNA